MVTCVNAKTCLQVMRSFRMNVTWRELTGSGWKGWSRAAAARNGAEMWVISADLELLHVSDPVVSYEATFSSMPFCHRTHWERLTTRPPAERRCASLKTLMQAGPDDRFVGAASPVYLRAVESDLLAGRGGSVRLNSGRLSPQKATRAA